MAQATDSGIIQAGVTLLLGVLGAAGTIYAARGQIRKHATDSGNEANQQLIDNALKLHEVYREENELIKARQDEQDKELSELRTAFNIVSRENETLKRENAYLKSRVAKLEARLDTNDLTPPPHKIP